MCKHKWNLLHDKETDSAMERIVITICFAFKLIKLPSFKKSTSIKLSPQETSATAQAR